MQNGKSHTRRITAEQKLIDILDEFRYIYNIIGQPHKSRAYSIVVSELRKLKPGQSVRLPIKGAGKGISAKIQEFFDTGDISAIHPLRIEAAAYGDFSKILGVGPATIRSWLQLGITSMAKLRTAVGKKQIILTHAQKLGLRYYKDLNMKIPRAKVAAIARVVCKHVARWEITGSYRRGARTSGDVDILIVGPASLVCAKICEDPNFVNTVSSGPEKITFLYTYDGQVVSVDIVGVPSDSFFAALNYFTGSREHNIWLRGLAKKLGYRLNQNGLFKGAKKISLRSEEEIYRILGLEYIAPHNR